MPLFLLKYGKYIALALAALAIIAGAYFAVQSYNKVQAENGRLKVAVAAAQAETKAIREAQAAITQAVDTNASNTKVIEHRTTQIETKVREVPVTTQCVESPALHVLLDDYNSRNGGEVAK